MKTIKEIKTEISEIEKDFPKSMEGSSLYKKAGKRAKHLRDCIMYLEGMGMGGGS